MNRYWYKTYIRECPLCGYEDKTKERQHTEKPENYEDRIERTYIAYHCGY